MNRIRDYRLAKGLTMAELGKRVDCSEAAISYYELGKREAKYETLLKIAEVLEVSVDILLGNSPPSSSYAFSSFSSSDNMSSDYNGYHISGSADLISALNELSDEKLDEMFMQLISGKDKDYLLRLASKILEMASQK